MPDRSWFVLYGSKLQDGSVLLPLVMVVTADGASIGMKQPDRRGNLLNCMARSSGALP